MATDAADNTDNTVNGDDAARVPLVASLPMISAAAADDGDPPLVHVDGIPDDVLAACEDDWQAAKQGVWERLRDIRDRLARQGGGFKAWCFAHHFDQKRYDAVIMTLSRKFGTYQRVSEPPANPMLAGGLSQTEGSGGDAAGEAEDAALRQAVHDAHERDKQRDTARVTSAPAVDKPRILQAITEEGLTPEAAMLRARGERNRRAFAERIASTPLPPGRYRCIVIDPPWPIVEPDAVSRGAEQRLTGRKGLDYPTMTLEQIAALPVPDLADPDGCHLYLWCTLHLLPYALHLVQHWGFRYSCPLIWHKNSGAAVFSWRYNAEVCLFAHGGKGLPLLEMGQPTVFFAPFAGHSVKPEAFYAMVEKASPAPRIDLFARRARDGWDGWGDEYVAAVLDEQQRARQDYLARADRFAIWLARTGLDAAGQRAVAEPEDFLPLDENGSLLWEDFDVWCQEAGTTTTAVLRALNGG